MKVCRCFEKVLALALLCLCSWTFAAAQANTSGASVSRTRAIVNSGPYTPPASYPPSYPSSPSYPAYNAPPPVFKIPEEIVVEEFVNYHKHRLPLPKSGQAYRRYPNMEDNDIRFILDIVEGYRRDLKVYNDYSRPRSDCGGCR